MNILSFPMIIVLSLVLIALILWRFIFSPLFHSMEKTSIPTREKVFPDIHKTINALISLSSSAIILIFSVLKIFEIKHIVMKNYLVMSWIGFTLTIILGIAAMLLLYITRTQYLVVLGHLEENQKSKKENKELAEELAPIESAFKTEKAFNVFLYIQFVSFIGSMILLVFFIIINF